MGSEKGSIRTTFGIRFTRVSTSVSKGKGGGGSDSVTEVKSSPSDESIEVETSFFGSRSIHDNRPREIKVLDQGLVYRL